LYQDKKNKDTSNETWCFCNPGFISSYANLNSQAHGISLDSLPTRPLWDDKEGKDAKKLWKQVNTSWYKTWAQPVSTATG
jgi:hypothetical protein